MPGENQNDEGLSEGEHDTENIFEEESDSETVEGTPQGEKKTVEQSAVREDGTSEEAGTASEEDANEPNVVDPEETTVDESDPVPTGGSGKGADEVFCSSCGEPIKKQAEICPHCGVRQETASSTGSSEKNPGIAAVASFFFPGLGDIYNGEFGRGAVIFVGWFVGFVIWSILITVVGAITLGIGLLAAPLYAVVNFVSAYLSYKRAERINAGEIQV